MKKRQLLDELILLRRKVADSEGVDMELRRNETRVAEAQRIALLGYWEWNITTNEAWSSDEVYRIFGLQLQQGQIAYETFLETVHPEDREEVTQALDRALRGREPYNIAHRIRLPDGEERVVYERGEVTYDEQGDATRMIGTVQDITERMGAENAMLLESTRAEALFNSAPEAIALVDNQSTVLQVNPQFSRLFEYTPEEAVGQCIDDLLAPVGLKAEASALTAQAVRGELVERETVRRRKDNRLVDVSILGAPVMIEHDQVAVCAFYRDVTLRRSAEEALRTSDADYRSIVERAPFGIFRTSIHDRFLMVNPALVEMLGYESEADLLAVRPSDLHEDPKVRERLIERDKCSDGIVGSEVQWTRKDGRQITVRLSGRPVHDATGGTEGFEMIAEDVTEQRTLEAQLRQSQKMEAIGLLTGGIAHDFNNILTVIMSNAELVGRSLPADAEEERTDLEELRGAAERGSVMIKKLLGFGRREKLVHKPVNLGLLVRELTQVLHRLIPESIRILIAADESVGTVLGDPGALEQILLNLATNARDAMPDGGTLRVECRREQLDTGYHATHPWVAPGEYSCVVVSDTGIGMDEETKRKIFEPFFTTKRAGEGTGLGMAMIYGLVKEHKGFVHVYSEPGQGTVVKLYFPATNLEAKSLACGPTQRVSLPRGAETILIVEDEQAIRRATKRVLEKCGYTILLACDGQEALEVFDTHGSDIDLILADLVMPRLGGRQLFDALRQEGNKVKFILTSGYTAEDVRESAAFDPTVPFLHKPWSLTVLLQCVRDVLDEDAGGRRKGTQAFRIV